MSQFSVVIPLYNKEAEICRTVASVLRQTHPAAEVIVLDDGSTDRGPQLVEETFGERVRLVRQANAGRSAARNAGLTAARHELIALLDADDEWEPGHLAEIDRLVRAHPEAAFYATRRFYVDEAGRLMRAPLGLPDDFFGLVEDFPRTFARGNGLMCSSSVCLRRSIFDKGLIFPLDGVRGQDLYYWLNVSLHGPLAFSAKPLAKIHLDASNRSVLARGHLPAHVQWYLAQKHAIVRHPLGKSVRYFVRRNALVQSYGAVAVGNRAMARVIFGAFRRHEPWMALLLAPSLLVPGFLMRAVRHLRHLLRRRNDPR